MNDISSDSLEKAKEVVALVDTVQENVVDPLAIEEDLSEVKWISPENGKECEVEVACDENTKESVIGVQNGNSETTALHNEPKEDMKEETEFKEIAVIETTSENSPVADNLETINTAKVNELPVNDTELQKETTVKTDSEIEEVTVAEVTEPEVIVAKVKASAVTVTEVKASEVTVAEVKASEDTFAEVNKESFEVKEEKSLDQIDSKNSEESDVKKVLENKKYTNSDQELIKTLVNKESKTILEIKDSKTAQKLEEKKEVPENLKTTELVDCTKTPEIREVSDSKFVKEKTSELRKVPIFKDVEVKKLLVKEETITKPINEQPAAKKNKTSIDTGIVNTSQENRNKLESLSFRGTPKLTDSSDVEMVELPAAEEKKIQAEKPLVVEKQEKPEALEKKRDGKVKLQPVNGDIMKGDRPLKRRASEEVETESPLKRLSQEVEKTFPHHDTMINDYIQHATKNNIDEIQKHTEQLLAEIQTLRELAQKKEHEWNNILHLKKVKEEILLRLLRRKQVLAFEKSIDVNGTERADPFEYLNQIKSLAIDKSDEISGLSLKQPNSSINQTNMTPIIQPIMPVTSHYNPMVGLPPPYDKATHLQNMQHMQKPLYQPMMMPGPMQGAMPGYPRDMNGQLNNAFGLPMGRQGPTKDVKSIIADYRQRNPDTTPRRGRRMKSILNPNMMNNPRPIAPKVDAMNNLNNLNMLFNNLDMNQKAMLERLQQIQAGNLPNTIFKDALVQFANMQQASMPHRPVETVTNQHKEKRRQEHREESSMAINIIKHPPDRMPSTSPRLPPPPPYPEISLLPVNTNQETQLGASQNSLLHGILTKAPPVNQSYSPTLAKLLTSPERRQSTTLPLFGQAKNCGEITITPVAPAQPPPEPEKTEEVVQLDDEESPPTSEESANSPSGSGRLVIDEGSSEEAPPCQGCRRRPAQFVCAGCANQWYCSRDCQVAAWDDHSDMCSG